MGLPTAKLVLRNACRDDLTGVEVDAHADTETAFLCIPPQLQAQLGLETIDKRDITCPDGTRKLVPYTGPVELRFKSRGAFTGAVVAGDRVILGTIPLDEM